MCSAWDNAALPALGFPIRASAGQWLFSASPRLIAAVHALLRLLVPRHPPCALTILTVIFGREPDGSRPVIPVIGCCVVFKVREEATRLRRPRANCPAVPAARRSLKTQQHASRISRAEARARDQPDSVDISSVRSR